MKKNSAQGEIFDADVLVVFSVLVVALIVLLTHENSDWKFGRFVRHINWSLQIPHSKPSGWWTCVSFHFSSPVQRNQCCKNSRGQVTNDTEVEKVIVSYFFFFYETGDKWTRGLSSWAHTWRKLTPSKGFRMWSTGEKKRKI